MKLARPASRGWCGRKAGAAALLVALALGSTARAESARRVVLVVPETPGVVATLALARVRGELQAARFEVETEVVGANVERRATIERELRKADARAAFGIFFGVGVAEIWVSDSVSGRTVVQTLPLATATPERRAAVLAVKAVDLLKATLAEVWVSAPLAPPPSALPPAPLRTPSAPAAPTASLPAAQAAAPAAPPPVATAPEAPAPPPVIDNEVRSPAVVIARAAEPVSPAPPLGHRIDVAAGAGWIGAGGATTWAPLLALSAFSGHLGARAIATGFGSSAAFAEPAGSARIAFGLGLAELAARQPIGRHFETTASLSAGVDRLAVDGSGAMGYQGSTARIWSAVGGGGVGAAVLISRLTIAVDARVLVSATATDVRIDGADVLRAGRPLFWVGSSVGVQL